MLRPSSGWHVPFLGVPYLSGGKTNRGADCYGLVQLVYKNLLEISLPSFAANEPCRFEIDEISRVIAQQQSAGHWLEVFADFQDFDVFTFRRGRLDAHIGLAVDDGRMMLHSDMNSLSRVELVDCSYWGSRLTGVFRHKEMFH